MSSLTGKIHVAGIAAGVWSLHVYIYFFFTDFLLIYMVGIVAGAYLPHLFPNVYSDVYIWKPRPGLQQSQQEESL